jgi:cytochrome P450
MDDWKESLTPKVVIAGVVIAYVTWGFVQVLRNVLFTTIPSSVPGPFIARLTSKWFLMADLAGNKASTVDALHKKYGPVVRVAPNELVFSSVEAIKPIYGTGTTVVKSAAYENFGRLGMFQMQDPAMHRERQKRVAHIFAPTYLGEMEPLIQDVVKKLEAAITKRVGQTVDALHWCRMTALDISGDILLGKSFGAFAGDGEAPAYVHHLDNAYLTWSLYGLAPLLCKFLTLLPIKGLHEFMVAGDYVYQVCVARLLLPSKATIDTRTSGSTATML